MLDPLNEQAAVVARRVQLLQETISRQFPPNPVVNDAVDAVQMELALLRLAVKKFSAQFKGE